MMKFQFKFEPVSAYNVFFVFKDIFIVIMKFYWANKTKISNH